MGLSARDEILGRIRSALDGAPPAAAIPRDYRQAGAPVDFDPVERFCERVADYDAVVHRVGERDLEAALGETCRERGAMRLAVPSGLEWFPGGVELVSDDPPLGPRDLDALDGVLSGCAVAIAETGTIVLDAGPGQGRRVLSLVPDYHLCVVWAADVVRGVPEAISRLAEAGARPLTWISGPSATSDIELQRVEGVHGPRTLAVVLIT